MASTLELEEGIDPELAEELMAEYAGLNEGDRAVFKVPDDKQTHRIRVLPGNYGKTGKVFFKHLTQHWGPDPSGKSKFNKSYACPQHQDKQGEPCPFCEAREKWKEEEDRLSRMLKETSDPDEHKKLKDRLKLIGKVVSALNYRTSYALNVVPLAIKPLRTHLFYAPKTVFAPILRAYGSHTKILDTEEGHAFKIERNTEGNQTKYTVDPDFKSAPLSSDPDEIARLMSSRNNLDKEVSFVPYTDLEQSCRLLLEQIVHGRRDSGDRGNRGERRRRDSKEDVAPPTRSASDIPDDDEDDDIPMSHDSNPPDVNLDTEEGDEDDLPAPSRSIDKQEPKQESKEPKQETSKRNSSLDLLTALENDLGD